MTVDKEAILKEAEERYKPVKSDAYWNANQLLQHCRNSFKAGAEWLMDEYAASLNKNIHDKLQQSLNQNAKDTLENASLLKENDALAQRVEWWKKETNAFRDGCRNRDTQIGELNLSNEAKDREIAELKESLVNTEKAYEIMRDKSEYWKQRCEAAEENIETYSKWQFDKDDVLPEQYDELKRKFEEANEKWQQLKQKLPQ